MKRKKVVKLTESDLERIIERVINEQHSPIGTTGLSDLAKDMLKGNDITGTTTTFDDVVDSIADWFNENAKDLSHGLPPGVTPFIPEFSKLLKQQSVKDVINKEMMKSTGTNVGKKVGGGISEQKETEKYLKAFDACRANLYVRKSQACSDEFEKVKNREMPSLEGVRKCAADIIFAEGAAGLGFAECMINAFENNPDVMD